MVEKVREFYHDATLKPESAFTIVCDEQEERVRAVARELSAVQHALIER